MWQHESPILAASETSGLTSTLAELEGDFFKSTLDFHLIHGCVLDFLRAEKRQNSDNNDTTNDQYAHCGHHHD